MRQYIKNLVTNEEGAEIIEYCAIIVVVGGLITLLYRMAQTLNNGMSNAQSVMEGALAGGGQTAQGTIAGGPS